MTTTSSSSRPAAWSSTPAARALRERNDPDLITAGIDIFATDRCRPSAVDDKNLPGDAVVHEGLVNKWPFDAEKKTYPYWDGAIGQPST